MLILVVLLIVVIVWVISLIFEILIGGFGLKIVLFGELVNIILEGGLFVFKILIINVFLYDKLLLLL